MHVAQTDILLDSRYVIDVYLWIQCFGRAFTNSSVLPIWDFLCGIRILAWFGPAYPKYRVWLSDWSFRNSQLWVASNSWRSIRNQRKMCLGLIIAVFCIPSLPPNLHTSQISHAIVWATLINEATLQISATVGQVRWVIGRFQVHYCKIQRNARTLVKTNKYFLRFLHRAFFVRCLFYARNFNLQFKVFPSKWTTNLEFSVL